MFEIYVDFRLIVKLSIIYYIFMLNGAFYLNLRYNLIWFVIRKLI